MNHENREYSSSDHADLPTERYLDQQSVWPSSGRHILASFDADTIVVYQAYAPSIAQHVLHHGRFGGEFRYSRMSWIKTNFLWMMYRSDWGRSVNQNVVLAIRLRRSFFDSILAEAVPSSFGSSHYPTQQAWKAALGPSDVRLQWDPDHTPFGAKVDRRAIQLGLRGKALQAYGQKEIVAVLDISAFVAEQRAFRDARRLDQLRTPRERPYQTSSELAARLGLATNDPT